MTDFTDDCVMYYVLSVLPLHACVIGWSCWNMLAGRRHTCRRQCRRRTRCRQVLVEAVVYLELWSDVVCHTGGLTGCCLTGTLAAPSMQASWYLSGVLGCTICAVCLICGTGGRDVGLEGQGYNCDFAANALPSCKIAWSATMYFILYLLINLVSQQLTSGNTAGDVGGG